MLDLIKQKFWQLLLIVTAATIYSFVYGLPAELPIWFIISNIVIFATALCVISFLISVVLRYSYSRAEEHGGYVFYLLVLGLLTCAFIVGIESIATYAISESLFKQYFSTIWARLFTDALIYVIFIMNFYRNQNILKKENEEDIQDLVPIEKPQHELITQISVKMGQKIRIVSINEIICIIANGDYVSICTIDGEYIKEQTMKYYQDNLPTPDFLRIHRSCIVKLSEIVRIERYGQLQQVEMRGGRKIKISSNGYKLLKEALR